MNSDDRIKRLMNQTAHPNSMTVYLSLNQLENELAQEYVTQVEALKARIAELESEAANLREVMVAAAEEINKHWDAHCDKEGYGPMSLCRRLEDGLAVIYPGYSVGAFKRQAERIAELEYSLNKLSASIVTARTKLIRQNDPASL